MSKENPNEFKIINKNERLKYRQIINELKQQLEEKDKELLEFKRNKLYFELLITRLQWLHKRADEYKEEKERFGIDEEISLSSVWDVLSLQKNNICEYEEMCELQEGIECIANSRLLKDIEHDLQIKATRKEDEIFKDIELINQQIKELKGEWYGREIDWIFWMWCLYWKEKHYWC